jgi:hypothetical protein
VFALHRLPIEMEARERGGRHADSLSYCNLTIRPSVSLRTGSAIRRSLTQSRSFSYSPMMVLEAELERELDLSGVSSRAQDFSKIRAR